MRKRMPKEILKVDIPRDKYETVRHRFYPIIRYRVDQLNHYKPLFEQLEELAFDCYTQGLIDGEQIGRKNGNRP